MPAVQTLIAAISKLAPTRSPAGGRVRSPGVTLRRLFAPATGAYTRAGVEPPLEEMLRDPIVRARMRCAGVEAGEVRRLRGAAAPVAGLAAWSVSAPGPGRACSLSLRACFSVWRAAVIMAR